MINPEAEMSRNQMPGSIEALECPQEETDLNSCGEGRNSGSSDFAANAELLENSSSGVPFIDALAVCPLRQAQSLLREILSQRKHILFFALLVSLCGLKFVYGSIFLANLLCWLCILFGLSMMQGLGGALYVATVNNTGIKFGRRNSLLQLDLPWQKLKTIQLQSKGGQDSLVLSLEPNSISFLQRQFFQDIILPSDRIVLKTGESSEDEKAFFAEVLKRAPKPLLIDCITDTHDERLLQKQSYVLSYEPASRERRKISDFLTKYEVLLLAPAFSLLPFSSGARNELSILVSLLAVVLLISSMMRSQLMSLMLNPEGICIAWAFFGSMQKSLVIPWCNVESVSTQVSYGRSDKTEAVVIKLANDSKSARSFKILEKLSSGLLRGSKDGKFELAIRTDALAGAFAKVELLHALSSFLPPELIDSQTKECLNPTDSVSYTQLWLDSFSGISERRFEGSLSPGQVLANGKFEVEKFIGAGGQASVYLARVLSAEDLPGHAEGAAAGSCAKVVLKEFILPSHAGGELCVRSLEHIKRELELMKKLRHEKIVAYYDLFVDDHRCYLVLEHVDGPSLRELVERDGPLDSGMTRGLAMQMAEILKHLHSQVPSVVHRDFTPENLILDSTGNLKLVDFNVAQELEESSTRAIVGKQCYLPPEQFRGKACPQSDIYAMGATLYFLLTGEDPEPISSSHPILVNESISAELDSLVASCTELDLSCRLKNADEVLDALSSTEMD